jgi:predicted nucleic acid-binding protein
MAAPKNRPAFIKLLSLLQTDPEVTIVPADSALFNEGVDLYARRNDKGWSLTDCISFVVMKREGLEGALTGDRNFDRAGFRALLA